MYTMQMVYKPGETAEDIGEVEFELKKNPDGTVGAPSKANWKADLTNRLVNVLRDYPAVKRIEFSVEDGE